MSTVSRIRGMSISCKTYPTIFKEYISRMKRSKAFTMQFAISRLEKRHVYHHLDDPAAGI
jgi:hypothetical protein